MKDLFDYAMGKALKEQGQDTVEEHNENFVEVMRQVAISISFKKGQVTSDDLREYALYNGLAPAHPNAWGAIFRGDEWERTAFTKSKLVSNHARIIGIWRYKG